MSIIKAVNENKEYIEKQNLMDSVMNVDIDSQIRLAEILSDSPRVAKLAGTEWEIRPLRMGTQFLIAEQVCKVKKSETDTYGDVVEHFYENIPALLHVFTLALLNDKNKIFKNGREADGKSELYERTYNTLKWEVDVKELGMLLIDVLQMVDVSFFLETLTAVDIFRSASTEKKRMRMEKKEILRTM